MITALIGFNHHRRVSTNDNKCITTCKADKQRFKRLTSQENVLCVVGYNTFVRDFGSVILPDRNFCVDIRDDHDHLIPTMDVITNHIGDVYIIGGFHTYERYIDICTHIDYTMCFNDDPNHSVLTLEQACPKLARYIDEDIKQLMCGRKSEMLVQHEWLYDTRTTPDPVAVSRLIRIK